MLQCSQIYLEEIITLSVEDSPLSVVLFDIILTFIYFFSQMPQFSQISISIGPIANVCFKLSLTPISGRNYNTKRRRLAWYKKR